MSRIANSARPRLEQLRGVGRGRWLLHPQVDPRVAVVAALEGRIDAGVDGVRLEVEDEGRFPGSARFSTIPAAAGTAAETRMAASSAATHLIEAPRIAFASVAHPRVCPPTPEPADREGG